MEEILDDRDNGRVCIGTDDPEADEGREVEERDSRALEFICFREGIEGVM